jgi:hypothetical protein
MVPEHPSDGPTSPTRPTRAGSSSSRSLHQSQCQCRPATCPTRDGRVLPGRIGHPFFCSTADVDKQEKGMDISTRTTFFFLTLLCFGDALSAQCRFFFPSPPPSLGMSGPSRHIEPYPDLDCQTLTRHTQTGGKQTWSCPRPPLAYRSPARARAAAPRKKRPEGEK